MDFPAYKDMYLPLLSSTQMEELAKHPAHLVIVPVGAIEQHGPHLPVGTDSLIGELLLNGLTEIWGAKQTLVIAPALTITKSNEHTGFPGSLFIQKQTLMHLLQAYLETLTDLGFYRIVFLNTHGGNTAWLRTFLQEQKTTKGLICHLLNPMPDIDQDPREATYGIHAGEYESSLLYAAIPEACKPELADCQWIDRELTHPDLQPEFSPVTFAWAASDLSSTGTMGDATQATAEKGELWISKAVASLVQQLKDLPL